MEKERAEKALRTALNRSRARLIKSPRPEIERFSIGVEKGINDMSEEEFSNLLAERMSALVGEERREAAKNIARKIACWRGGADNPLSLREEMLIELQAALRRHEYHFGR